MSQGQTKTVKHEQRAAWIRPQVRRIKAGSAEAASGTGGDAFFS
ncbi:hypothetical protein [Sphingomonas psychrotolerans]|nr:hypothetical protein [Sphingomonas psychrotolerans]